MRLDGQRVTLRLAAVDTEEKISGRPNGSPTKPQTVFGHETTLWAKEFFAALGEGPELGLVFPEGRREDVYGRLLCHVLLPDGTDFNLQLVREGRSPYFNKYGNSPIAHAAFVAAQKEARAARRGIWDPRTNRAACADSPSAVRSYEELLPWWEARARAIDSFRRRASESPGSIVAADDPEALARAFERCRSANEQRVTVFAAIQRLEEGPRASMTVVLRHGQPGQALRAELSAAERPGLEHRLRRTLGEFRQNYLLVTGRLLRDRRGFRLEAPEGLTWTVADPPFPPR